MIRVTNSYPGLYVLMDVTTKLDKVYMLFPKNAESYFPFMGDLIRVTGKAWSISQFNPWTTIFIQAKSYEDIVITLTEVKPYVSTV